MSHFFKYIDTEGLDKKVEIGEYPFSENLFVEKNLGVLNLLLSKNQIIETALTIGLLQDFYVLLKLYTKQEITTAIKSSKALDKKTANFCHLYFNIPKEDINADTTLDYSNYKESMYYTFNIMKGF
jgi:hypothetical protein